MILRRRPRSLSASRVAAVSGSVGAGVMAALIGLSACSGESAAPDVTVVAAATSTTFRTEPVRTTTTTIAPPPEDEPSDSDTAEEVGSQDEPAGEQSYEVRGGDYLVGIARQFGVTAEAIAEYNGWEGVQHPINPGESILIPPEDWTPDEAAAGSDPQGPGSSDEAGSGDGTCPDGSEQETYTIRSGDVKGAVARRFDVTVAELDAANAATPYYAGFVIGIDIVIPC